MITDDAPADSAILWVSGSGDTGRGGVERRSLLQVTFTHQTVRNRLSRNRSMQIERPVSPIPCAVTTANH